jgi:hypothetical protein
MKDRDLPNVNKNKTHCMRGHPLSGENLRITKRGYRNCKVCLRASNRAWAARARKSGALRNGYTANSINNINQDVLRHALESVAATKKTSTAFEYIPAQKFRALTFFQPRLKKHIIKITDQDYRKYPRRKGPPRVVAALRNDGADAYDAIIRATSHIWEGDRGDVQALMWIDVAENRLKLPDCTPEKAREYLKIHNRRPNVFGSYSLDTPIGEDGGMTWLDTKTDEDRLWA